MSKRIISLLWAVLTVLCAMSQNAVGDWLIHTSFVGDNVTTVADAKQWVYYLAGGNLFRLDKTTQENESLSIINELSDMTIDKVYYNTDKDYVVVIYSNANIDVICSDGEVVNMPEIKDAVLTSSKAVNDVTFADGVMYVATDFGYVVIDDRKFVVKESHLYGEPLISVARMGDKLLLSTADAFYYGDADEYHEQLSSFNQADFRSNCRIWPISDSTFYCMTGWTFLSTMTIGNNGKAYFNGRAIIEGRTTVVQKTADGFLLNVPYLNQSYIADKSGEIVETLETPGEICSSHPDANGTVWAAGAKGLHQLGSESYYRPNALSFGIPFWMTYNKSKDLLYVSSPTANGFFKTTNPCYVNTFDGMVWEDVTPEGAPKYGTYWIEFLPDDANTYFIGAWTNGLHKVVNNEIVLTYNADNSPMVKEQGAMHPITSIDRYGNVWVVQPFENKEHPVMVLPAAKAKLNQVTKEDWSTPVIDGIYTGHTQRGCFLSTRNSNYDIKVFTDGDFEMPVFFWNSAGEITSHPQQASFSRFTDQDGLSYSWTYIMCLTEDLNGTVWMGSTEGIVSFNPAQAFSGDFRVNHIKVPRNDGTGMADYLLDGIQVNDIAVDGANRKWIATQSSGLFLVSPDGTQVINKFNTTNSPLASNTVYKVCCAPNNNSVFITTPAGLYEYFSDSSPAENSYDHIFAYPNPVRPEFGGNVTLTGMMDNSLVKIADSNGFVIRQLKSTGGMTTWDCCDQYGQPVKTGVYLVLCSQANGSGEAVVTKIAVIR
ncbi:MAG: hypothetical protein IKW85_02970 [Muribaculaceae bacterium]|nr:hypothetical protein [Muribaculaceae bacterium]